MAAENELDPMFDPTTSTLAFFGAELRLRRELAGLSQTELAKEVHCAPSLLSKIESAKRVPKDDLAVAFDAALGTDGFFARLWPVVIKNAYPAWFRPYIELEEQATGLQWFENQLVPGLLQTEDYARAVLKSGRPDCLEQLLFARMHRQRILTRDDPPQLWTILDETLLRRSIGGPGVMRAQLGRLLEAAEIPRIIVQVVPFNVEEHPSLRASFNTLSFAEGPDVLLEHGLYEDYLLGEPEAVAEANRTYDLLRAVALPPRESTDLIASVMKELNP
ncbi:helix-turn-helix domain-containing protein [Streptomyces sp. KR80]|uniref:helix-turn-helix domain-containing protein n=1 Tax=Streptomyces sp. KR80 TaxID=3457426 RepID=UPI003FD4A819